MTMSVKTVGLPGRAEIGTARRRLDSVVVGAVNRAASQTRTSAARDIAEQVAYPGSYLSPSGERLFVRQRATRSNPTARIVAIDRPTSLARFATGRTKGAGVSVRVSPGRTRYLRKAFLIRLRSGSQSIDTKANLGLAVRLRPGERIQNKNIMRPFGGGLYLLYGPSVGQVFSTLLPEIEEDVDDFFEVEFDRLFAAGLFG